MAASYFDIINEAIDLTVTTDINTGVTYLEPLYREILRQSDIEFDANVILPEELFEILKLEVDKRNAVNNHVMPLAAGIGELIEQKVDPIVEAENNQMLTDMLKYLDERNKLKEKELELDKRENDLNVKTDVKQISGGMLNLSKKK